MGLSQSGDEVNVCIVQLTFMNLLYSLLLYYSSWDNSRIASGGADKIVFLTDVGTGQPIRKLRGHLSVSGNIV